MPIPTTHEGYHARQIEAIEPGSSWKVARNRKVKLANERMNAAKKERQEILEIEQQIGRQKEVLEGTLSGIMGQLDARRESRSREEAPRRRIEPIGARKSGAVGASAELTSTSRGQRKSEQPNYGLEAANTELERRKRAAERRKRAVDELKQKLDTYRLKLLTAWNKLRRRLQNLRRRLEQLSERNRNVDQALEIVEEGKFEPLQASRERVRAVREAKPKPAKKLSLAGGLGSTSTAKKPEKSTIEGAVYGQSQVAKPSEPKRPQNAHTAHEEPSEEEIYARLTEIFATGGGNAAKESATTSRNRQAERRKRAFDRQERELNPTVDVTQEHRLAEQKRAAEQRKREAEAREARSSYQLPIYHDQGPDLDL